MSGIEGARRINMNYGMPVFSRIEIRDITIAVLTLTAAFAIIFCDVALFSNDFIINLGCWILASFIIVILSFMTHEFGHKFTAQRFGAWSEFRMYPVGLVLCLIFSFLGFLFAAPGAVYIRGYINDEMNGKISMAGPLVNIIISAATLAPAILVTDWVTSYILFTIAYLNAFLALFNMIPIPPLDGSKIMKWNVAVYIIMIVAALSLIIATIRLW